MPQSLKNLSKVDLDPLFAKFGNKTATWKGGLMAKSSRLVLLKSGLTALVIYMMTVHKLSAWALKRLVQLCHAWLWSSENTYAGGKCRVSWNQICRPKHLGGFGVMHLAKFGTFLRLRWLWLTWQDPP